MVNEGGGENDFIRRLEEDGLKQRGADRLIANMVAVYVSLSPRYSAIRGGDDFNAALGIELGGQTNAEIIRSNELNPGLASGDFTKGFVDALTAIEGAAASPPDPSGGIDIDPTPIVLGLLGAGGAAVGAGALVARRRRALALQGARERYTTAQREAGAAIADTGQAIENTAAKAQYDRVSYGADDVARLAAIQQRVTGGFAEAQQLFDQTGERFNQKAKPQIADYDAAATAYKQVGEQVAAVRAQLDEADALRRELDGLAQQAPAEIDRAKKA
jgi:hypothetical protein